MRNLQLPERKRVICLVLTDAANSQQGIMKIGFQHIAGQVTHCICAYRVNTIVIIIASVRLQVTAVGDGPLSTFT
ncbi:hypothetical protein [Erwinia tracheiphila]|uniref:Uncharacterized protein n=1 Tax=Erwinia tracheiphila TaxID=65700 RepID=A0A0M2KC77_9GAMM|nr:hypothetical protein [Erwinia tracheiphila]KKF36960.1 hypothetical protein SY86_18465 [Erwinia tracheiphila]